MWALELSKARRELVVAEVFVAGQGLGAEKPEVCVAQLPHERERRPDGRAQPSDEAPIFLAARYEKKNRIDGRAGQLAELSLVEDASDDDLDRLPAVVSRVELAVVSLVFTTGIGRAEPLVELRTASFDFGRGAHETR